MTQIVNCPNCGKPIPWSPENKWRPFCCERCKLIDFGDWANETNRIAGEANYDSGEISDQNDTSNTNYNQFPINKKDDQ